MTPADFRRIALSMPEATEGAHMDHPDFRVSNKIFATLGPGEAWGMVKLTPEQQRKFVQAEPAVFVPVKGAWGRQGATTVVLEAAKEPTVRRAMLLAWRNRARSCSAHNDFRRARVALKFSINCSFGGGFNGCTPFGAFTRSRRDATILVGIKRRIMDKRCGGCASDCSRELMTYCSTRERWCTTSATLHSFSDGRRVKRSSSIAPTRSRRPRWVESSLASVLFNQVWSHVAK